ncbi:ImmA/IrrE family metallo-endopeptidase [Micromonospora chokoriensis]
MTALEQARGREIRLAAMTIDDQTPCGLWVAMAETDYVLYNRDSSLVLQLHTILHELMHIGLGHTGGAPVSVDARLADAFDAVGARVMLARSAPAFAQQQEHDAELLATYLGARLDGEEQIGSFDQLGEDTAAVMYRIAATLAD